MSEVISIVIYLVIFWGIISTIRKKKAAIPPEYRSDNAGEASAMPHKHKAPGSYESYSGGKTHNSASGTIPHKHETKKFHNSQPGAMPHKHETAKFHSKEAGSMAHDKGTGKYRSMADASQLPKGYILLNGEPVRVADLEDK